jgi:hypothetical protein
MPKNTRALTAVEAVIYLQDKHGIVRSLNTLNAWVTKGIGPTYIKVGVQRRYFPDDLEAWVKQITSPRRVPSKPIKPRGRPLKEGAAA